MKNFFRFRTFVYSAIVAALFLTLVCFSWRFDVFPTLGGPVADPACKLCRLLGFTDANVCFNVNCGTDGNRCCTEEDPLQSNFTGCLSGLTCTNNKCLKLAPLQEGGAEGQWTLPTDLELRCNSSTFFTACEKVSYHPDCDLSQSRLNAHYDSNRGYAIAESAGGEQFLVLARCSDSNDSSYWSPGCINGELVWNEVNIPELNSSCVKYVCKDGYIVRQYDPAYGQSTLVFERCS